MTHSTANLDQSRQQGQQYVAMPAEIDAAWSRVLDALKRDVQHHNSAVAEHVQLPDEITDDDRGMRDATAEDLLTWVDDVEDRILDHRADGFRTAMQDFLDLRGDFD